MFKYHNKEKKNCAFKFVYSTPKSCLVGGGEGAQDGYFHNGVVKIRGTQKFKRGVPYAHPILPPTMAVEGDGVEDAIYHGPLERGKEEL